MTVCRSESSEFTQVKIVCEKRVVARVFFSFLKNICDIKKLACFPIKLEKLVELILLQNFPKFWVTKRTKSVGGKKH